MKAKKRSNLWPSLTAPPISLTSPPISLSRTKTTRTRNRLGSLRRCHSSVKQVVRTNPARATHWRTRWSGRYFLIRHWKPLSNKCMPVRPHYLRKARSRIEQMLPCLTSSWIRFCRGATISRRSKSASTRPRWKKNSTNTSTGSISWTWWRGSKRSRIWWEKAP